MNYGFNVFKIGGPFRPGTAMIWRTRLLNFSWLVLAGLFALMLLRVADGTPQGLRDPAMVAKLLDTRLQRV